MIVLYVLAKLATGEAGRVVARCRAQCAEEAGVSLPTWKRWVGVLLNVGYLERVEGPRWELGLRVTEAGLRAASSGSLAGSVSRVVSRGEPARRAGVSHPLSSSFLVLSEGLKKEGREVLGGSPVGSVSRGEPGGEPAHPAQVSRVGEPGSDRAAPFRLVLEAPDAESLRRLLAGLVAPGAPHEPSIPLNIRAEAPAPRAEPVAASAEAPAAIRPSDGSHATWARLREAWLNECGLPSSKCSALDNRAWLDLCSRPDAPKIDALLAVLRREGPKWHERAAKAKHAGELDPWASVPSVRTWLQKRPWELAPDPAPRSAGERPKLAADVAAYVEDMRAKANAAALRSDPGLAADYRRRIARAMETGAVP